MYQIAALGVTLVLSITGGLLCGFIVSNCCAIDNFFDDEEHFREVEFDIPLEEVPEETTKKVEDKEIDDGPDRHSVN